MGSSEIVDSGKFSGQRSNFSQTCNLLSQYLKEKGSFGELSLGLSQNLEHRGAPTGTMNLLPKIENSGKNSGASNRESDPRKHSMLLNMFPRPAGGREETLKNPDVSRTKSEAESAQMTIFYAGQVIVFNDFPAEKANEIMMLASKSSSTAHNYHYNSFASPTIAQSPAESVSSFPKIIVSTFGAHERAHRTPQPSLGSDLPIARKNSLARFLEKRKDRITANEPYQARKPAAPFKPSKNEAWLGLGPQIPLQFHRH